MTNALRVFQSIQKYKKIIQTEVAKLTGVFVPSRHIDSEKLKKIMINPLWLCFFQN